MITTDENDRMVKGKKDFGVERTKTPVNGRITPVKNSFRRLMMYLKL